MSSGPSYTQGKPDVCCLPICTQQYMFVFIELYVHMVIHRKKEQTSLGNDNRQPLSLHFDALLVFLFVRFRPPFHRGVETRSPTMLAKYLLWHGQACKPKTKYGSVGLRFFTRKVGCRLVPFEFFKRNRNRIQKKNVKKKRISRSVSVGSLCRQTEKNVGFRSGKTLSVFGFTT